MNVRFLYRLKMQKVAYRNLERVVVIENFKCGLFVEW